MLVKAVVNLTGDVQEGDLQKVWRAAKSYEVLRESFTRFSPTQQTERLFSNVEIDESAKELAISCEGKTRSAHDTRLRLAEEFESAFGDAQFTDPTAISDGTPVDEISIERRLVGYQLRFVEP